MSELFSRGKHLALEGVSETILPPVQLLLLPKFWDALGWCSSEVLLPQVKSNPGVQKYTSPSQPCSLQLPST